MNGTRDPRVDTYIANAAPFAQPIICHLRELIFQANPDVTETIKWGAPAYEYKGILAIIGAMKSHAFFSLWKGELIPGVVEAYGERFGESVGTFGRMTSVADIPPDHQMIDWIRRAIDLNERGVKLPQRARSDPKPEPETPDDLIAALELNEAARLTFERFPPSKKRDYIEWLTDAKTDATRQKRLAQAIEWMAEGKSRMWKYERT